MSEAGARAATGYRKRFYKVGEVCALTGLEGHVLRYWESELPMLRPRKSRGGQRLYSPEDVELVIRIKGLLHEQGYTMAGALRYLQLAAPDSSTGGAVATLDAARTELRAILTMMQANDTL